MIGNINNLLHDYLENMTQSHNTLDNRNHFKKIKRLNKHESILKKLLKIKLMSIIKILDLFFLALVAFGNYKKLKLLLFNRFSVSVFHFNFK